MAETENDAQTGAGNVVQFFGIEDEGSFGMLCSEFTNLLLQGFGIGGIDVSDERDEILVLFEALGM